MTVDWLGVGSLIAGALMQDCITCVVAGVLIAQGKMSWSTALLGCFIGVMIGDLVWVAIGRVLNVGVIERWLKNRLGSAENRTAWREWMRNHGVLAVFISRFTPTLQVPLHLLNGFMCGGVRRLLPAIVVASVVYVGLVVSISYGMAESAEKLFKDRSSIWLLFVAGLLVWLLIHFVGRVFFSLVRPWIEQRSKAPLPRDTALSQTTPRQDP